MTAQLGGTAADFTSVHEFADGVRVELSTSYVVVNNLRTNGSRRIPIAVASRYAPEHLANLVRHPATV